ncbi:MAG: hypothetical protein AAGF74_15455 [Pseudomonadota bacterium]
MSPAFPGLSVGYLILPLVALVALAAFRALKSTGPEQVFCIAAVAGVVIATPLASFGAPFWMVGAAGALALVAFLLSLVLAPRAWMAICIGTLIATALFGAVLQRMT